MSVVLVTGATGLVGLGLVERLAAKGEQVRALVRDAERARKMLPAGVELAVGDVTAPETLEPACTGARLVFHAAGMPEQWQRDDGIFDRVNRQGTANMLGAALRAGVGRVVYTSTMDVFGAPPGGTLVETAIDPEIKPTAYERSKQAAEKEAEKIAAQGLDLVYVNPGAVYGPSPLRTAMNGFFVDLLAGKIPLLPPGGLPLAFLDGVVDVHLAAAERGKSNERYLVADDHVSMVELARLILEAEGKNRKPPRRSPKWLVKFLAAVSAPLARLFGFKPLVAPGELQFLLWDIHVDATKAQRELGFVPTPLKDGIQRTVDWFKDGDGV
jgi:dihydroflavonol-4-reductase